MILAIQMAPGLTACVIGMFVILVAGTIAPIVLKRLRPEKDYDELTKRVRCWWVMVAVFVVALLVGRVVSICLFAFMSFLALKEYVSIIPTRRVDRRVLFWAYLTIPLQYYWVSVPWYGMFIVFIPVYMFLLIPVRMVVTGETKGFLHATGTLHWGMMISIFSLSHAAYLLALPNAANPNGGSAALLFYLIFLTEFNDVAQYIWGKSLGKRKVLPKVSPGKTWAGLLGGVCTTTVLALGLAKLLTPLTLPQALLAGLIIGLGGFAGDITISALKRDLGIKDTGSILPGHGGILDRIDSLSFTAPLFFHFVYYLHY
jgi:phosphatidate cytidylyltransferase